MMKNIATVLGLLAMVGCGTQVVYVYPDSGTPLVDAQGDAGASDSAEARPDAGEVATDAWRPAAGACEPDRVPGQVGHTDCRSLTARPICDAISDECVGMPADFCGACANDAQCGNFDLNARCVFIAGDVPSNNDSACLSPCESDADCDFLRTISPAWATAGCFQIGGGSYCAPNNGGIAHCRDASGQRL